MLYQMVEDTLKSLDSQWRSLADTLQQFAGSIDIVALPRLAAGTEDHPVFANLARLL